MALGVSVFNPIIVGDKELLAVLDSLCFYGNHNNNNSIVEMHGYSNAKRFSFTVFLTSVVHLSLKE